MTMPSIPRILATTALYLAAVGGQSSCVSRLHRVAYEFPRSYEGAWMQNNSEAINDNAANMRLTKRLYVYESNGQWYLPVSRIQYRKSVIQGDRRKPYEITDISHADKGQYYLPISAELAKELCTSRRLGLVSHELAPPHSGHRAAEHPAAAGKAASHSLPSIRGG